MSAVLAENLSRIYTGGNKAVDSILMIPVMASSVMAASSFVGEKENTRWKPCFILHFH